MSFGTIIALVIAVLIIGGLIWYADGWWLWRK
jgi:hypothetical protein